MTGPEHFREAENCIEQGCAADEQGAQADAMTWLTLGQVHATLALAAAFACARLGELPVWDADAWQDMAGTQPSPQKYGDPGPDPEGHDDCHANPCQYCATDDEGGPQPEEYDPGPEADDEGGMSEYRYILPEDYQRGRS